MVIRSRPSALRRRVAQLGLILAGWNAGWLSSNLESQVSAQESPPAAESAETSGQEDLDKATLVKLSAKSMGDLETVVTLCDSALKKGLDEDNEKYARDLMTATLYDQASRLTRLIFDQQPVDPRWPRIRQLSLERLNKAIEVQPDMGNVHLLIARLQALPNGDREQARAAADKAISLLADDANQLSVAYQTRAALADNPDAMLADLAKAVEADPRNMDATRMRGVFYLTRGEIEKALTDFQDILSKDPDDLPTHQAIAQAYRAQKQYDKALEHLGKVLENDPQAALAYNLRAQIREEQGDVQAAVEDLNEAIKAQPQDLGALLMRSRLRTMQQQFDLARSDIERVLQIRPGLPQAILLRSLISASQDRLSEAIGDIQQLLRQAPDNEDLKLQLATYYEADQRPRKAIELYTEIVEAGTDNWPALRRRGDAYLSIGKHAEAIADYNRALEQMPDDTGLLNNLAWVLATSPEDPLRDGKRALELAKKACELTQYNAPHILSTLAACHAELGQFEDAIRWSQKATENDPEETQLSKELESYKESKAWREKQMVEENAEELVVPDSTDDEATDAADDESDELRALEEATQLPAEPSSPPPASPNTTKSADPNN